MEGPLEKDFVLLNKFDPMVLDIQSQPFTLKYVHPSGRTYNCTPDFLVTRMSGPIDARVMEKLVYEVRTKAKANMADPTFAARFKATSDYCRLISAEHRIATEVDIRIPRLKNAKLLLPYSSSPISSDIHKSVRLLCRVKGGIKFGVLVQKIRETVGSDENRLASIYRMLLNRHLAWDLDSELTSETKIYDWDTWPKSRSKKAR